jgi:hypothetical protein
MVGNNVRADQSVDCDMDVLLGKWSMADCYCILNNVRYFLGTNYSAYLTYQTLMFVVLLWVCIHTGQAETFDGGNRTRDLWDTIHSRTQSPSYARCDEGLWPNPYQTGIWLATTKVIVLITYISFTMFLWFPVLDLARAPRRTARKKGSGYENVSRWSHPRSQGLRRTHAVERPWERGWVISELGKGLALVAK